MGGGDTGGNFPVDPDPVFSSDDDDSKFGCGDHTATTADDIKDTSITSNTNKNYAVESAKYWKGQQSIGEAAANLGISVSEMNKINMALAG